MQYRYKLGKNGKYEAVAIPAKRVDIVKVNLIKEASMRYRYITIKNTSDAYELMKQFQGAIDREYFMVV